MTIAEVQDELPLGSYLDSCPALQSQQALLCMASAAAALNQQVYVEQCTQYALTNNHPLPALYEALLQTYLFAGFPAALEALSSMNKVLATSNTVFSLPLLEEYNVEVFRQRGEQLCAAIYTRVYEPMRQRLRLQIPHLDEWMIVEGYGKTLSRPFLTTAQRELCIVALLACSGWKRQLFSHIRGALNVGATPEQCQDAVRCTLYLCGKTPYQQAQKVLEDVLQSRTE